jgi:hypothetical protein
MRLRDHPAMSYRGSPMWPPVWVGLGATQGRNPRGEVGCLKEIRRYPNRPRRIFITMEYGGAPYTGALLFDENASFEHLYKLLQRYYGSPIVDIGNLDVPLSLNMASTYRKASACQTWHFCSNCSHWPEDDFEQLTVPPEIAQLCNECKTLREVGNCQ